MRTVKWTENRFLGNSHLFWILDNAKEVIEKQGNVSDDEKSIICSRLDEIKDSLRVAGKLKGTDVFHGVLYDKTALPSHALDTVEKAFNALDGKKVVNRGIKPGYYPMDEIVIHTLFFLKLGIEGNRLFKLANE